jgi:hypothetical protein
LLVAACASEPAGPDRHAPLGPSFEVEDEDHTAPVLTALGFSPTAITTTGGSATVTVSYTVTDDLAGATAICARFDSPSGTQVRSSCTSFTAATTHSGTIDLDFPPFGEGGTYTLEIYGVGDAVGNVRGYSTEDLAAAGFPTELAVTSVQDNTAPVLTSLGFSPTAINTTAGSATVTISYSVTDDLSGANSICARFDSPSGAQVRSSCVAISPATSHSGSIDLQFPQFGEGGTWLLEIYGLADAVGNVRGYSTAELAAAGFPTGLTVTSVQDNTAPVLTALSFSPAAINTTAGSATVTVSYSVTDDLSGANSICARFDSPSGTQVRSSCVAFEATAGQSGSIALEFPQFGEGGTWLLEIYGVGDAAGNVRGYETPDLAAAGYPTELQVNQSEPVVLFLHGSGGTANPPTLSLDDAAPAGTTPKYKDSPAVNFAGGNPWKDVGTWSAAPAALGGTVSALSDVRLWVGLKNSDDIGTRFDIRVEARRNGTLFAAGETQCVQNVVRNANQAREVLVGFAPFSPQSFNGTSDAVSLRILTRVGTNGSGGLCGGHSNAVGLRVYFDASTRPAAFEAIY